MKETYCVVIRLSDKNMAEDLKRVLDRWTLLSDIEIEEEP